MKKLAIFDLDGTLLDTLDDLATSANYALFQMNLPTHPLDEYRYFIGGGIARLVEAAMPIESRTEENVQQAIGHFIEYYSNHLVDLTKPYPGIVELLKSLNEQGIKLAVASNKVDSATILLVNKLLPEIPFVAIFGEREGIPRKPDPRIVYDILDIAQCYPQETLFIGDSGVDMLTARHSGCTSVGVSWGFRPVEELDQYGAHYIVEEPYGIGNLLNDLNRSRRY